jgi:hypothetical protein
MKPKQKKESNMKTLLRRLILASTPLLLSACGGGTSIIENPSGNNSGTSWRLTFIETDFNNDGVLETSLNNESGDKKSTFTYDSLGNLLFILSENFGSDVGDIDSRIGYTYNGGNKVTEEKPSTGVVGSVSPFTPSFIFGYNYGGNGKVSGMTRTVSGSNTIGSTPAYSYDNLTVAILPPDYQYIPFARRLTYTYDSNQKLLTKSTDNFADGSIDYVRTYSYVNNKLSTETLDGYSSGAIILTQQITYGFNNGNLDTVVNGTVTKTYYYDSNGNLDYIDLVDTSLSGNSYKKHYTWVQAPCNPLSNTLPEPSDKPPLCTIQ